MKTDEEEAATSRVQPKKTEQLPRDANKEKT
jgi:hypothetical protein